MAKQRLTKEMLENSEYREVLLTGVFGFSMMRWAVMRGGIGDWALYTADVRYNARWVADHGDKALPEEALIFVECDEEVLGLYRSS